jgi:hypothetical protein
MAGKYLGPTLWIVCPCGRNLAEVTKPGTNPDWTRDGLLVTPRPNVAQSDFRPWHEANRGGSLGTPGRAQATPGLVEGKDFDWHDRTYSWRCKCGRTWERRHESVSRAWLAFSDAGSIKIQLGRDV